jgi:hypothetical protein
MCKEVDADKSDGSGESPRPPRTSNPPPPPTESPLTSISRRIIDLPDPPAPPPSASGQWNGPVHNPGYICPSPFAADDLVIEVSSDEISHSAKHRQSETHPIRRIVATPATLRASLPVAKKEIESPIGPRPGKDGAEGGKGSTPGDDDDGDTGYESESTSSFQSESSDLSYSESDLAGGESSSSGADSESQGGDSDSSSF